MVQAYKRLMDHVHAACVVVCGVALVIITLVIPFGVFMRYVMNAAASWPEPLAILLMIWLSFLSAVICYREHLHIAVAILPNALTGSARIMLGVVIEMSMLAANLFLLWFGLSLVQTTWGQTIAEFPAVSVGFSYLPIPIGGALTALFVIERFLLGNFFPPPLPDEETISAE